jgi:hypothetical protein
VITIAGEEQGTIQINPVGVASEEASRSDRQRRADHAPDQYFEIIFASASIQLERFC